MKAFIPALLLILFYSIDIYAQCEAIEPSDLYACESDGDGIELFDLTVRDAEIIGDNPMDDFFVTYHETDFHAEDNTNILPDIYEISNPFFKIIFARLNQISTGCFDVVPLTLRVDEYPPISTPDDIFIEDTDNDGIVFFDLTSVEAEVLAGLTGGPYWVTNHLTEVDAENWENFIFNANVYEFNSMEEGDCQEIYVRVTEANSLCHSVINYKIGIFMDPDFDGLTSQLEDLNENGDYDDDDTDGDDIPNYLDSDDDNDLVETSIERMGDGSGVPMITGYVDTDGDTIENYLDNDDDEDGVLTADEDYNNNGSPLDDDTNNSNIPDFLEQEVALSINDLVLEGVSLFPSPVKNNINLEFSEFLEYVEVTLLSFDGKEIMSSILNNTKNTSLDVQFLSSGVYFISLSNNRHTYIKKFIKY